MDVISYALSKKIAAHAVSGVQSMSVNGQTLTINTKDSGVLTMTFPTPKDGVSVTDIDVNTNNQIVFTMSDGSKFISGKIPTVKGEPGFSPTITENADNTDKIYKLDITTEDSTFTTPNLKGADGQGGGGGDSSVTLTQEEYEALTEEQKLNGLYYIYDTKRIYKNGVQYGASEPIPLTMAEYEALKEAGAIDEQQEYLIEADDEGILISAEDIGYNNAKSGIQATTVQGAIDKIAESGGSGEKNVQSDWNETDDTADGFIKNKPTIPDAYDDTALSNRVKTIEDDYAKSSDIPSLSGYATETWVNEQGFLTQHQDLSAYATKDEIPTVPSKVSELTNDSNYQTAEQVNGTVTTEIAKVVADAPEDFNTLKEMSDWIAGHENDASAMNSAISDNKTAITALQTGKADKSDIPTSLPANGGNSDTVNNHTVEIDVPTDAVFTDTIYNDIEVKENIAELNNNLDTLEFGEISGGKNLWDEQWKIGVYTESDGIFSPSFDYFCSKNKIKVKPNTTYRFVSPEIRHYIYQYDINGNYIGRISTTEGVFPTDNNAEYIQFVMEHEYGKTYNNDIAIIEDTNGTYEPYIPSIKILAKEVNAQNESLAYNASKNMLTVNVGTISGVTITSKDKSTALLNGTSTANVSLFTTADVIPSGSYHLKLSNKVGSMFVWDTIHSKTIIDVDNTECNFTLTEPSKLLVGFSVGNGHSFTNFEASGQLEKGTVATDFVPYNGKSNLELTNDVVSLKNDLDTLEFSEIAGGNTVSETSEIKEGYYADGDGSIVGNTSFWRTEKYSLAIKPMTTYTINLDVGGVYSIWFVDSSKKNIEKVSGGSKNNFYFTTPENAAYLNVSGQKNDGTPSKIWLNEGTESKDYEPYIPSVKMLADEVSTQNESLSDYGMDNKASGWLQKDSQRIVTPRKACNAGNTVRFIAGYDINYFGGKVFIFFDSSGTQVGESVMITKSDFTCTVPSGATAFEVLMYKDSGASYSGNYPYSLYVDNAIDKLKNDLDKLSSLPKGSIIQIEAAKDNIETTEQKYGWQYLGTSNIECDNGAVLIIETNVYRKNN